MVSKGFKIYKYIKKKLFQESEIDPKFISFLIVIYIG